MAVKLPAARTTQIINDYSDVSALSSFFDISGYPLIKCTCSSTLCLQENHDALIKCLSEYRRFENKKPSAACIVYKSLLQWHSFQAEKTNIFDRIIQTIRSFIEVVKLQEIEPTKCFYLRELFLNASDLFCSLAQNQENVGELAYWLSTTSTLLLLLQKNLKASSTSTTGLHRSRTTTVPLFSRMARV